MNNNQEWDTLLACYLNGTYSEEDFVRLNQILRNNAQARRDYVEMLNLDSALQAMAAATEVAPQQEPRRDRAPRYRIAVKVSALAAALALAGIIAWIMQGPYATVTSSAGATLAEGKTLRNQKQSLDMGNVEFVTARGARVVIEAPAEFCFESAQKLHLTRGRASADVPPSAKGFTIVTPSGDAVDLGTQFGVDVPTQGAAEIHVFKGEVIAQPKFGQKQQSLRGGEALALQPGSQETRETRNAAFINPEEMASLSAGLMAGQRVRSDKALEALRHDPTLITLLDFESTELPPGVFRMVQGRWPGSRAPEFVNEGDHMKLDVGGDRSWPQLTMAAWVRLDRLGAPFQSLYHTDGWHEDQPGQVHWIINRDTTMRLALRKNVMLPNSRESAAYPDSLTPVLPERGRWVHLAVVYDHPAHLIRFYLNGMLDREVMMFTTYPARLGPAQIGNWNQKDRKLSGRVDELVLLGRAMSTGEIRALHDSGNPYR